MRSFNPHTHAGCDQGKCRNTMFFSVSIHTPTQGVTAVIYLFVVLISVSIHTPTQGVTIMTVGVLIEKLFQSTHPRRV